VPRLQAETMASSSNSIQDAPPQNGTGGGDDASKTDVSRLAAAAPTSPELLSAPRPPRAVPGAGAAAGAAASESASQTCAHDDVCPLLLASLPHALLLQIFAALPADTRLRCAEVCRGWRSALTERSLWTLLDLSMTRVTPALLRAAAAKARGALTALNVSGCTHDVHLALRDVLAANAGTLRELRCMRAVHSPFSVTVPDLEVLLGAAPQLHVCEADVLLNDAAEARRALRNEGVFEPLRVHAAGLPLVNVDDATALSLLADMAAHASLTELHLFDASFYVPALLDAFVDAALALPL
jgi:hypothetical protein